MASLAPTPITITPSSADSPSCSTPTTKLLIKPAALVPMAISPSIQSAASSPKTMVSKEWVIPPRPKPGRKPATDTPPTKRKAQNRAAQRAFRERRAARVGELEEQLEEQKKGHDQADRDAKENLRRLELEVQSFKTQVVVLQNLLDKERQERIRVETELQTVLRMQGTGSQMQGIERGGVGGAQKMHTFFRSNNNQAMDNLAPMSQMASPADSARPDGCGGCEPNGPCICEEAANSVMVETWRPCDDCELPSRCECIEMASKLPVQQPPPQPQSQSQPQTLKRQLSPSPPLPADKRARAEPAWEIDLTTMLLSTRQQQQQPQETSLLHQDSGADRASAIAQQMHTPPPCDSDPAPTSQGPAYVEYTSTGAVKLPKAKKPAICGPSGPGTCSQCIEDPNGSGRFCRMLAAKLQSGSSGPPSGGCCGGRGPGGGCCKSTGPPTAPANTPATPSPAPGAAAAANANANSRPKLNARFSVAEAYRTLSSHREFDKAFNEASTWLPKLRPVYGPPAQPQASASASVTREEPSKAVPVAEPDARIPIEVEAASVMSVLRHFDVRFGRDC